MFLRRNAILKFLTFIGLNALFLFSSSVSFAKSLTDLSPAETIGQEAYNIQGFFEQFQSTSRLNVNGEEIPFNENEDFFLRNYEIKGTYGWGDDLDFYIGGRFRQVSATLQTGDELTNSGAESVYFGAKYSLKRWGKNWLPALEASFRRTLYGNTAYQPGNAPADEIILGDNGNAFQIGAHLVRERFIWDSLQFRSFVAYHRPPNDLSQEILYDFGLYLMGETWILGGGFEGIRSMGFDDYESDPTLKPDMSTGPTNLFNSINREKLEPYGEISYKFSQTSKLSFRGSQVMAGSSTDKGVRYLLSFSWGSQGVTKKEKKVRRFKEYLIDAIVMKVSPRGKFVRIDHGLAQDVEKGMRFDIYQTDYFGGNVLVASGLVYEVGADWAIVRLMKRYKKIKIKKGFAARGR